MNDGSTSRNPEVLVVGAGPTGLVAAAQLAERGIDVRIIEVTPVRSDKSRALGVQARTLELLDKMDLAEPLMARGQLSMGMDLHVEGKHVAGFRIEDLELPHSPLPYLLFVSQVETERLLDDHLARLGVEVERPVELLGFEQDEDGVQVQLRRDGVEETIRTRYLIGADGAHSTVRHTLQLPFRGAAYETAFILGDVRPHGDLRFDQLQFFLARRGLMIFFPMAGGRIRVMATGMTRAADAGDPTLEELQQTVSRLSSRPDLSIDDPTWLASFRLHHRGVDRYRVDRVFLAGDAAHIHSPAGGQGMNTGIQDAFNLAWKLAAVLRGQADDALLDSYEAERLPVGNKLLQFTDRLFGLMSTDNRVMLWLRNHLAPLVIPRVIGSQRSRVLGFVSQTGIRYRKSPAVGQSLQGADRRFRRGPQPGDRAPGAALPEGRFMPRMSGTSWWLLGFCGTGEAAELGEAMHARVRGVCAGRSWIRPLVIDTRASSLGQARVDDAEGTLHQRYGLTGPGLYLVRPDGHIAFRSPTVDTEALERWLDAQGLVSPPLLALGESLTPREHASA